jgi:hypothetical protein
MTLVAVLNDEAARHDAIQPVRLFAVDHGKSAHRVPRKACLV